MRRPSPYLLGACAGRAAGPDQRCAGSRVGSRRRTATGRVLLPIRAGAILAIDLIGEHARIRQARLAVLNGRPATYGSDDPLAGRS